MRVHLIDGTYELFRAHYSKRPDHATPDGRSVKATVGMVWSLLNLIEDAEEDVTHLAIAFDNPIRSFRNDLFDGYKSDDGVDPILRAQFDLAERAARAAGVVVWSMDRWEADDALATGARRFAPEVEQVRLLTPDKDLGQCLEGDRVVLVDRVRSRVIDEAALRESRGIAPKSVPDFLALVGDTADGIPGLSGFGQKSAAALLQAFNRIEEIPGEPSRWPKQIRGADRLAATLSAEREEALLYRRLATLAGDVPLAEGLGDLEWRGVPRRAFEDFCEEMGTEDLFERPRRWSIT